MSSPTSNQLMWNMLSDENDRVIGNALLGLHQMGDVAALPHIFSKWQNGPNMSSVAQLPG